ncbi:MAG TPA: precorrin-2 C(20)-methyltransferase [Clostridia bacterium]|nr:precorrin-2 C(20)-methyltransferase [Clostridia bacterium]
MAGKLWGIGVGPGDPELITVKAVQVLQKVPVVAVPQAGRGRPSLAYEIARRYLRAEVQVVELVMPMTEDRKKLEPAWDRAAWEVLRYLRQDLEVAFLTLGDPSLYSTFGYLAKRALALEPALTVEVIPGITSFAAAAARLAVPLAEGDEPLVILPAAGEQDLAEKVPPEANLVLMKVSRSYDKLVAALARQNRLAASFLVSRVGQAGELVTGDLQRRVGTKVDYLSLIISRKPGKE